MSAQLIKPDQLPVAVSPANGTDFQLEELYALLNCELVQVIEIDDDKIMILDEEGKLNRPYEFNAVATAMVIGILMPGDSIVGPVIVCQSSMLQ